MRVKATWNTKDKAHSLEESASVLGFNIWKLCGDMLLDLENENFQVDTYAQRLDVMAETAAFLLQVTDRMVYGQFSEEDRMTLIRTLGIHLMETMQDNRVDAQGEGDYRNDFVQLLNDRAEDYAECNFDDGEPGFSFRRNYGVHVMKVMGERDNRWVQDYVMDVSASNTVKTLKRIVAKAFPDLVI